ncbi:MAG: group III truncated hemoglobin [Bacteroidia bacterium]|jgi:hemoglobin|nr:group III truncated hemoglobin [Bacteroidia bacterium]MBP7245900.1 group III truncated hemoglobin [Bacteroidia bacterium]
MKKDIESREDVELLVNTFYDGIKVHNLLGPIFNVSANVNWETHLPKMYSFWSSLLLGEHSFTGNPMATHIALSKNIPLTSLEFSEWIQLFNATVDDLFEGEKANEAKIRAANIARLMLFKIEAASSI